MMKRLVTIEILFLSSVLGIYGLCDVKQCVMKGDELLCRTCIPNVVPEGVMRVNVTTNTVPITIQTFSDVSWRMLEYLDITEPNHVTVIINGGTFSNLRSIKYLGLHLQLYVLNSSQIHNSAFDGLDSLDHLNITDCIRFSFEVLFSLFKNETNFRNLSQLSLGNFNKFVYGTRLSLNDSFLESLAERKLEMINCDGTQIDVLSFNPLNSLCASIKSVSAKKTVLTNVLQYKVPESCTALRHFDLSNIQLPTTMPPVLLHNPTITIDITAKRGLIDALYFMKNVESATFNNFYHGYPVDFKVRFIFLLEINDTFALKHLSLQNNNVVYLDAELHTTSFIHIESFDGSYNKLTYLSPRFFGNMTTLRNISLTNNRLQRMAENERSDFENIFMFLKDLRMVDISNNALKSIPGNMFTRIKTLEYLLLSGNSLTSFSQQGYMMELGYLDLRRNMIVSLDSESMIWLANEDKRTRTEFYVDLQENTFRCSCDNLTFANWLVQSNYVLNDTPRTCVWNGESLYLNNNSVQVMKDECVHFSFEWLYITLGVSISTGVLVTIIWTSYFRLKERFARVRRRRQAIADLVNDRFPYQYLAYVSFSLADDDVVFNRVIPVLKQALRGAIGDDHFELCLGELGFHLGGIMLDEVERCLHASAVMVSVISHNYCDNKRYIDELNVALRIKKPILFVLIEDIPEHKLPAVVKRLLKTNEIVRMEFVDGQPQFDPSLEQFCIAMLEMVR